MQKRVNFIVTDLDDTIWDWLTMWYNSFNPFLERISKEFSIDLIELKKEFKTIHQKYGTSEASFIINDLTVLSANQKQIILDDSTNEKSIMHEYYSRKKQNLKLYDQVLKTLLSAKSKGVKIIGFTESHSFYTKYRLKTLNLDGVFDCIYAPIDYGIPDSVKRVYPEGYWEPSITEFRYLAREVKKPNAEILEIILKDFKAKKENSIYIGDKLDRDIYMAKQAGITSVYAKYGHKIVGAEYDLLKEVTHWTDEDVAREIKFKQDFEGKTIIPDVILETALGSLQDHFEFFQFDTDAETSNIGSIIEIWKKSIDVQQHFNDIELRIRNYALTIFTATVAGIGFLEKERITFLIHGHTVPASGLLSFVGLFVLLAFWYMDRYWYHNLLLGAVKHASEIESSYSRIIPVLGLTNSIGKSSPHLFFKWSVRSTKKYWIFYGLIIFPLLAICLILCFGRPKEDLQKIKASQNVSQMPIVDSTKNVKIIKKVEPDSTIKN